MLICRPCWTGGRSATCCRTRRGARAARRRPGKWSSSGSDKRSSWTRSSRATRPPVWPPRACSSGPRGNRSASIRTLATTSCAATRGPRAVWSSAPTTAACSSSKVSSSRLTAAIRLRWVSCADNNNSRVSSALRVLFRNEGPGVGLIVNS